MRYTITPIRFDEIFSEDAICFSHDGKPVEVSHHIDQFFFEGGWLHLEIYDTDSNIWHVSFQTLETENKHYYLQDKNLLMIAPSIDEKIYLYSLVERKCLEVSTSHNQFLIDRDEANGAPFDWLFLEALGYLVVQDAVNLSVFDVHGLKWQVTNQLQCCYMLSFSAGNLIIHQHHGPVCEWRYDVETGALLSKPSSY